MKHAEKRIAVVVMLYVLCCLLLCLSSGCGGPPGEIFPPLQKDIVWPEPPEQPRIKYIGALSTEADLKRQISWTEGLSQLIFGKKKMGVLITPYDAVIDNNRLFVTDLKGEAVHMFDLASRNYKQFSNLAGHETMIRPVCLAIVDTRIYVVDSVLHKVCVFDRDGKFIFSFGQELLKRPSGIAYWQGGEKIYVADTARHIIEVFSKNGTFVQHIGSRGLQPGSFNFPTHLCVDQKGNLYVSDTLNYRVQVFSDTGMFLQTFGLQGDRPGNFAHPSGIATDSYGHIYVADRQFENIQIFNEQGKILMSFGQEGREPGQFWLPGGIFIDDHNRIYVADSFNKRIQIFELIEETVK